MVPLKMVIFHFYVSSPEGKQQQLQVFAHSRPWRPPAAGQEIQLMIRGQILQSAVRESMAPNRC